MHFQLIFFCKYKVLCYSHFFCFCLFRFLNPEVTISLLCYFYLLCLDVLTTKFINVCDWIHSMHKLNSWQIKHQRGWRETTHKRLKNLVTTEIKLVLTPSWYYIVMILTLISRLTSWKKTESLEKEWESKAGCGGGCQSSQHLGGRSRKIRSAEIV